jgi:hypothetical protein
MTTQPTTSPTDQNLSTTEEIFSSFAVSTVPLYGILVTEKSFLLGKRALALQNHASYLAHRVAGARLPAELCDQIASELAVLRTEGADRLWESMKDNYPSARAMKFQYAVWTANLTASEKAGLAIYSQLSKRDVADGTVRVQAVEAHLGLPGGAARGNNQRYIHLSASLIKPSVSMLAPGRLPGTSGPSMSLAKGTSIRTSYLAASALRTSTESVTVRPERSGAAARLLQLDDVEDSIHGWNLDLIESFVGQLELEAVIVQGEGGTRGEMEPRLRLLQRLKWGQLEELSIPRLILR